MFLQEEKSQVKKVVVNLHEEVQVQVKKQKHQKNLVNHQDEVQVQVKNLRNQVSRQEDLLVAVEVLRSLLKVPEGLHHQAESQIEEVQVQVVDLQEGLLVLVKVQEGVRLELEPDVMFRILE